MAKFIRNKPVTTTIPKVKVELNRNDKLDLGMNRFQLVVVDDAGNESDAAFIEIMVKDNKRPTAHIDLVDGNGKRLTNLTIREGQQILLSGERSEDHPPGKVVQWKWTWVSN